MYGQSDGVLYTRHLFFSVGGRGVGGGLGGRVAEWSFFCWTMSLFSHHFYSLAIGVAAPSPALPIFFILGRGGGAGAGGGGDRCPHFPVGKNGQGIM